MNFCKRFKVSKYITVGIWIIFMNSLLGISETSVKKEKVLNLDHDTLFQISTNKALEERIYDGRVTVDELKKYGNLGIGTLNGFDGELVGVDGEFYRIQASDGISYRVAGDKKVPYAIVTHFDSEKSVSLKKPLTLPELQKYISKLLPHENIIYAFKIEGRFSYIKTRSVFPQKKPYPKLMEIIENQVVFEFEDIEGSLVGFWFPLYLQGVSTPGFHLHFISKDKKNGGHLLECQTEKIKISIDKILDFHIILPYDDVNFK